MEVLRRMTVPCYNKPFLQWYSEVFDSVFIALHPFFTIDGIDPSAAPRPVLVAKRENFSQELLTTETVAELSERYSQQFSINQKTTSCARSRTVIALIQTGGIRHL